MPACSWVWARGDDGRWPITKWAGDAARAGAGGFPTSEEFLVGTDRADTNFPVDHIHSAEAEGWSESVLSYTLTNCRRGSPGAQADPPGGSAPALGHPSLAQSCPSQPSPVEADLVETLFTRLVDGVEAGARVLFFTAVWGQVGHTGGSPVRSGYPRTLQPCPDTHTDPAPR